MSEIIKVDLKGRITIPQTMREALEIRPGMLMVLIADAEKREIIMNPVMTSGETMYEFDILLADRPGSLASVTNVFAEHKADIVASKCASITRGEEANCIIVADMSLSSSSPEKIREDLEALETVIQVKMRRFESRL
ncbi:MAG: ACT domain-containing protein [Acidilobaceae archaeon]|nr:ACT domain-containing protein [Acidilobaceae archaeon]MDW7973864.1 ACT domain-containing protein [Sulfolobales archaeon]